MSDAPPRSNKLSQQKPAVDEGSAHEELSLSILLREGSTLLLPLAGALWVISWIAPWLDEHVSLPRAAQLLIYVGICILTTNCLVVLQRRVFRFMSQKSSPRRGPQSRFVRGVKLTLTLVLIPAAVAIIVAELPPVSRILDRFFGRSNELAAVTQIGNIVLSSTEVKTKEAGIEALATIDTRDSVAELGTILDDEQMCFRDAECYNTMRSALADATDPSVPRVLVAVFERHLKEAKSQQGGVPTGQSEPALFSIGPRRLTK